MQPVSSEFRTTFGELLRQLRKTARMRQLDLSVAIPVHSTVVSRWESGSDHPSLGQLEAIRKHLPMKPLDYEALYNAWQREAENVPTALLLESKRPEALIEFLDSSILYARRFRQAGQPRLSMGLAERDVLHCLDRVREFQWSAVHEQVLIRISELLLEHCKAGLDFLPRKVVKAGALVNALRLQRDIAHECQNPLTFFLASLSEEGATYVGGNTNLAFAQTRKLLAWEWPVSAIWRLEVLRAAAINAGMLGDRDALVVVDQQIADMRERQAANLAIEDQVFLLEGLARGWGGVDPGRGLEVLRSTSDLRNGTENHATSALRSVQLVRTEAEIVSAGNGQSNHVDLVERIEASIRVSASNGYDRHLAQLRLLRTRLRS